MSFFKFTIEIGKRENQTELYKWVAHFERTGMPAGLVENDEGLISVWRAGMRRTSGPGPVIDAHEGVLMVYVNGFEKLWAAAGGVVAQDNDHRLMAYRAQ